MNLAVFLLHFFYIALIFLGGVAIGYLAKEKIESKLNKVFKKDSRKI
jgi:uncharacterized BrkB/YihY/UPF0761 family membrane protein